MLLLITGSRDGTSDRIVLRYGEGVFRLNYDLWRDYSVTFTPNHWTIRNPAGLEITSQTASGALWWKAFSYSTGDDRLVREEVKYFLRDLYGWFRTRGISKGNSVDYHNAFAKINILGYAEKYFSIPESLFSIGLSDTKSLYGKPLVAKSLSSEISSNNTVMLTTVVPSVDALDPKFPWFLQEVVVSDWDVTVFLCGGALFPFRRSRKDLKGIDWRAEQDFTMETQEWFPFEMQDRDATNLILLAADLSVEVGRFDFMTKGASSDLVFLEFNATGQWVFLDPLDRFGLLDAVVAWLKKPRARVS